MSPAPPRRRHRSPIPRPGARRGPSRRPAPHPADPGAVRRRPRAPTGRGAPCTAVGRGRATATPSCGSRSSPSSCWWAAGWWASGCSTAGGRIRSPTPRPRSPGRSAASPSRRGCAARTSRRSSTARPRCRATPTWRRPRRARAVAPWPGRSGPPRRGLPVPGDLRDHAGHHRGRVRGHAGRRLRGQHGRHQLRAGGEEEPHPVRRPHHRVDDRARGGGAGRAPAGGQRHREPAAPGHEPGHRRHGAVRHRRVEAGAAR